MQVVVFATGKCGNSSMLALEAEYVKRLGAGWKFAVRELPEKGKEAEGVAQMAAWDGLPSPCVRVVLDERGEALSTKELAAKVGDWRNGGIKAVGIVIGGADGVSEAVRKRADVVLSFGRMTFPHQLMRVLLAEQVYRVATVLSGHPYHRE